MAATHNLQKLAELTGDFVVKHHGTWNHNHWEGLCKKVTALGVDMDESFEEHLGMLLEHLRVFYFCMPPSPPAKAKAKPKAKPKAKAKSKAKAKTAAKPKTAPAAPGETTSG